MNKIVFFFAVIFMNISLQGQTFITGKLTDSLSGYPVSKANIALYKVSDGHLVKSVSTNDSGKFSLKLNGSPQFYYLNIEALGYRKKIFHPKNSNPVIITLSPDKTQILDEVTISARKKAIALKGDKIIYDIEQMGTGSANNGLETIQQLPGMTLDKDENIRFRGSTAVQIMIDGKKSMLTGDALREYIRSLNGDDIKSVEIISQPSARYEATGTTGILNIVLKKNISKRLGGSILTYIKYGKYYGHNSGARFFYNNSKWSINANGSYYQGESFNDRLVNQNITTDNGQRNLDQSNYWYPKTERKSIHLGIERKINKNQLISTEWKWYSENEDAQTHGKTLDHLNGILQSTVNLKQKTDTPTKQISGNIFYSYSSDSLTTKAETQLNFGYYRKSANSFLRNEYNNGEMDQMNGQNQTQYNMMNAQTDWSHKLSKQLNLESGAKFSFIEMNYQNRYDAVLGNHFMIPDSLMVNDFKFKEQITSLYSQLNFSSGKWNWLAGIRMENYYYKALSEISDQTNTGNYTSWFPSASVNYENRNHQFRLSYSRRISRPEYLKLNPYAEYLDAYSIEKGNPKLKPQFYDSFELNYIFKNTLSLGFYGYLYKDGFLNVIDYQSAENYNILYQSNAAKGSRIGFSGSFSCQAGKWWSMQYSLDAHLESETSDITNYKYDGKGYGYEFNVYHQFRLPEFWIITWNGFLNGKNKTATGYSPAVYDFSVSVRKSLMNEKLQLIAGCTNILKNSKYNRYSTVEKVSTHWINKWETQKLYLQITYRFGGNKEKKIKSTTLDDEEGRM